MKKLYVTARPTTQNNHFVNKSPVSYTHLDVYKRQGVDDENVNMT